MHLIFCWWTFRFLPTMLLQTVLNEHAVMSHCTFASVFLYLYLVRALLGSLQRGLHFRGFFCSGWFSLYFLTLCWRSVSLNSLPKLGQYFSGLSLWTSYLVNSSSCFFGAFLPPGVSSCSLIWNMVLCLLSCLAFSVCLYEVMQICAGFEGMSSCGGLWPVCQRLRRQS